MKLGSNLIPPRTDHTTRNVSAIHGLQSKWCYLDAGVLRTAINCLIHCGVDHCEDVTDVMMGVDGI